MQIYATFSQKVEIDPISVVEQLHFIPKGNWIREENGKYIEYEEVSAGTHSFEHKVGEVPKETYDLYMAQIMILNKLKKDRDKEIKDRVQRDYKTYFK